MRATIFSGLLLAGCTSQAVMDKMTTQKERAEIVQTAESFCDAERFLSLKSRFASDLWSESEGLIAQGRQYCPRAKGVSRLIGYKFNIQNNNGVTTRFGEYVVVTESPGLWTITSYATQDNKITGWNLNGSDTKPGDLAGLEAWDAMVPKLRIGLGLFAALLVGLIGFFVVRRIRASNARPLP